MDGQMNIFDFLKTDEFCRNKTINELVKDLHSIFPDAKAENYKVWEHVPNLGKRLWVKVDDFPRDTDLEKLEKKYLAKGLEITVNIVPSMDGSNKLRAYISTLWKTKGHKEV